MKFVQWVSAILSVFVLTTGPVFAQTPIPSITIPKPTMTKTEYILPYPGILPDSPLYVLKTVRDRILDFLIVDPFRKAEFYILQADKRLGMGVILIDKGKKELGEQTIAQGEKYFTQVIAVLTQVKQSGKEIPEYLLERATKSMTKHEEVLRENLTGRANIQSSLDVLKTTIENILSFK